MASVPSVAVALLAAGQSRRFGAADKLAAEFQGKPLFRHAADTLAALPFTHRWLIASREDQADAEGFETVRNPHAKEGLGTSVALAARLAEEAGVGALLVALADMPFVPAQHFAQLMGLASPGALVASHNGMAPTPPALFGREHIATMQDLSGDAGARDLLRDADELSCDPAWLIDIDTPESLRRYA